MLLDLKEGRAEAGKLEGGREWRSSLDNGYLIHEVAEKGHLRRTEHKLRHWGQFVYGTY